jgi:hypothetical protein
MLSAADQFVTVPLPVAEPARETVVLVEVVPPRVTPAPNRALLKALHYVLDLASEPGRATGNGGLAAALRVLVTAYEDGRIGALAKHIAQWQADKGTDELRREN